MSDKEESCTLHFMSNYKKNALPYNSKQVVKPRMKWNHHQQ